MNVPFLDLKVQYRALQPAVNLAINQVLARGDYILGEEVGAFEEAFARYCGAAHAIGVDSGYSALELILRGYGIGPGDEVITAANTFVATVLAISICGARPVLVDTHPTTYTLDPEQVEAAITPATRAIMPVHLYGQTADMQPLVAIARRHHLLVIEDAAQAHGACYHGRRTGVLGDAAAFSFYPGKNLGAYGDGGAVVTQDAHLAHQVRLLRNLGQRAKYDHQIKGFNRRLDTLQAAILLTKLPYLDGWNAGRRRAAATYAAQLADLPVYPPVATPDGEHVYHLYVIRTQQRDQVRDYLTQAGIGTGLHYPTPIHLQPAYQDLGYRKGAFPVTEALSAEILSLPMYAELSDAAITHVVATIAAAIAAPVLIRDGQS